MVLLQVKGVHKWFEAVHAVDDVTFSVKQGEIIGLIGPNGSGKSTLFNLITGLFKPDMGEIYFNDQRITRMAPDKTSRLGIVRSFQIPRLFLGMTTLENILVSPADQIGEKLQYAPRPSKWWKQETELGHVALPLLDKFELRSVSSNRSSDLSGGQMKLLEVARAAMMSPKLFLLDEPTAGVAPRLAQDIFDRILYLKDKYSLTYVIIEHRLSVLFSIVQRVIVMDKGKMIFDATPDEARADAKVSDAYLGA